MRVFAHLVCAAAVLCTGAAAAQTVPSVEAYGRLPLVSDAAISPDGTRIVQAISSGAQSGVRVINIDTGATEHALSAPEGTKVRGVGWADDQRALYLTSEALSAGDTLPPGVWTGGMRVIEYWRTSVLSLATGRGRYIEFDEEDNWAYFAIAGITAPVEGDPGAGRMISYALDGHMAVFRVDLDRARARALTVAGRETVDIVLNDRGTIGARMDSDERTNRWRMFYYVDGQPRQIMEGESEVGSAPGLAGFLDDGRLVLASGRSERGRGYLYALHPLTGARETLADHERHDVSGALADPWTHRIVGAAWTEDLPRRRYFDPAVQAVQDQLQQRFETGYAVIVSWSRDKRRYLVFGETHADAGAYYVFEPATGALRLVGQTYPELSSVAALGNRQAITYRARDGVRIPAYLTMPANVEARNLPAVLLVHGGPHARDTFTFDWWASFLASRGYAVLQPNYRGSTGYGYDWYNAGRGGWGDGVMQHDVEDGLAALVRAGIVDPQRVCIVGGSYGGYAALAGATLTPDLYACAISVAGVSDLLRMLDETVRVGDSTNSGAEWWRDSIGDRTADRAHLRSVSPAYRAADVRAPILLLHGPDDTVVEIAQSRIMRDRLQQAGKQVRYVELEGDDHWLSLAATRTQMLREMEVFLNQHIGAGSQ